MEPNDIYLGNGVSELIPMTLQALLNTGDEILVPMPDYPPYGQPPRHLLAEPRYTTVAMKKTAGSSI